MQPKSLHRAFERKDGPLPVVSLVKVDQVASRNGSNVPSVSAMVD